MLKNSMLSNNKANINVQTNSTEVGFHNIWKDKYNTAEVLPNAQRRHKWPKVGKTIAAV